MKKYFFLQRYGPPKLHGLYKKFHPQRRAAGNAKNRKNLLYNLKKSTNHRAVASFRVNPSHVTPSRRFSASGASLRVHPSQKTPSRRFAASGASCPPVTHNTKPSLLCQRRFASRPPVAHNTEPSLRYLRSFPPRPPLDPRPPVAHNTEPSLRYLSELRSKSTRRTQYGPLNTIFHKIRY